MATSKSKKGSNALYSVTLMIMFMAFAYLAADAQAESIEPVDFLYQEI